MPSLGNFDPNQYQNTYDPIPAGDYLVVISESSINTADDGSQKIKITMEVMQPEEFYGRKCFASFTLEHSNPGYVETGRKILSNVCRAVGVMAPRETEELHGIPFFTRLVVEQWKDGSLHNECKAYWSTQSQAPPQPKPKAPKAPTGPGSQYQPPAPPAWQPPTAPQQRPQAPQQPWQQPQGGAPGGYRPAPPQQPTQQWQQPAPQPQMGHSGVNPWPPAPVQAPQQPQQPYYPPQAPQQPQYQPQPQQQHYQPPAQPQAPQAPAGPPPWAQQPQQAPQPQQQAQLPEYDADGNEIPF